MGGLLTDITGIGAIMNYQAQKEMQKRLEDAQQTYAQYREVATPAYMQAMQQAFGMAQPANEMLARMHGPETMLPMEGLFSPELAQQLVNAVPRK
jgi:hypothetical protein